VLFVAASAAACRPDASEAADDVDTEEQEEGRPEPLILETEERTVEVTRTEDLTLEVRFVYSALTQLLVDGVSVGTMGDLERVGRYRPNAASEDGGGTLELRLDGAMIPGEHEVQLYTPGTVEPLRSNELLVRIVDAAAPTLEAELESTVADAGGWLVANDGLVGVVRALPGKQPKLTIVRPTGGQWDEDGAITLALPGYEAVADELAAAVSLTMLESVDPGIDRLRLAWRVGNPGERIDFADVIWSPDAASVTDPETALTLAPDLVGTVEWAELGRPVAAGDTLVAELYAPHDTESPVPGDRALVSVALWGTPPGPGKPSRVQLGETAADMDAIGPALDLAALGAGAPRSFSVRVGGHGPAVIDVAASLSLRAVAESTSAPSMAQASSRLVTVLGAFGSRTVAAVTPRGVDLFHVDASGENGATDMSPAPATLPEKKPSADCATGVIAGAAVFLVPYGDDAPVHAVRSVGTVDVQALEDLHCDAVELAPTVDGNDSGTLDLACLSGDDLLLGSLRSRS
jgi:hypothetical protein